MHTLDGSAEMMAEQPSDLEAARRYLARGWSVLPLRPRDKRPLILWEHLQHERPSEQDVVEWFRRWPDANIGIVTGEISNLIVLDIDPKHGGDAALGRLEQRFGPLSATVEAVTGGDGRHLYFAHPGGLTRNRAGLAQGIDLRGDGGYIVAPPSIHPTGRPYSWIPGRGAGRDHTCSSATLDPRAGPRSPCRALASRVAPTGARRCAGGRAQFDNCLAHRTFAVARRSRGRA